MKIGRNEPCPCGSGKKYKNCCYSKNTSVDFVPDDAEFITNKKGAKIYLDESYQPKLSISEGSSVTYEVLSVGFSNKHHPIATIKEGNNITAYILPDDYLEWCQTCVGLARMGNNMFPSKCVFSLNNSKYYVDIQ